MSRFTLSRHAQRDLDQIRAYTRLLPMKNFMKIGRALQKALGNITQYPFFGAAQSEFTRLAGVEVRSRLVESYRIFYTVGSPIPEVIAVLHTSQDIDSIVTKRLQ